jgi:carbonic anhydrase/acetyltransferase-like protein (isoleucine patch superfamily)
VELPVSIRVYKDTSPDFGRAVYIDVDAVIIGDVVVGRGANIWPGAVLRGDVERITVGAESSVQDNAVLHCDPGYPMLIGQRVVIGHGAILHGVTIGDDVLVGMGSILLNGCAIGTQSIVGAGSLVTQAQAFPPRSMIMGAPAKLVREVTDEDLEKTGALYARYFRRAQEMLELGVGADLAPFREKRG